MGSRLFDIGPDQRGEITELPSADLAVWGLRSDAVTQRLVVHRRPGGVSGQSAIGRRGMLGLLGVGIARRGRRLPRLYGLYPLLEQLYDGQPVAVLLLVVQQRPQALHGQRPDAVRQRALGQVVVVRDGNSVRSVMATVYLRQGRANRVALGRKRPWACPGRDRVTTRSGFAISWKLQARQCPTRSPDVSADQLADERRAIWQIGSDHWLTRHN